MPRHGLSKRVVTHNTRDLPNPKAQRLQGFNGTVDQLLINLNIDTLRTYLQENYGPMSAWLPPLQRMIGNHDRMTRWELAAVKRVIREVDGKEA